MHPSPPPPPPPPGGHGGHGGDAPGRALVPSAEPDPQQMPKRGPGGCWLVDGCLMVSWAPNFDPFRSTLQMRNNLTWGCGMEFPPGFALADPGIPKSTHIAGE